MLVSVSGEILMLEFNYNGFHYKIISTKSNSRDSIWKAIDTIKRNDGLIKDFTRQELKNYFNNKNITHE